MAFSPAEQRAMRRALELASTPGVPLGPNPRVGCVLVRDAEAHRRTFQASAAYLAPHPRGVSAVEYPGHELGPELSRPFRALGPWMAFQEHGLDRLRQVVEKNVEQAANAVGGPTASGKSPEVVVQSGPSLTSRLFGTTQRLIAALLEIFILLYFLLAGGDLFLQKLIKVLPHFSDKVKAVEIARATESAISPKWKRTPVVASMSRSIWWTMWKRQKNGTR